MLGGWYGRSRETEEQSGGRHRRGSSLGIDAGPCRHRCLGFIQNGVSSAKERYDLSWGLNVSHCLLCKERQQGRRTEVGGHYRGPGESWWWGHQDIGTF